MPDRTRFPLRDQGLVGWPGLARDWSGRLLEDWLGAVRDKFETIIEGGRMVGDLLEPILGSRVIVIQSFTFVWSSIGRVVGDLDRSRPPYLAMRNFTQV